MIPIGPYRNDSCRKLAEKVAKGSYDSLNINVNIDSILQHKDPETTKQVISAVQEMRDFILYANDKDYAIVIPRKIAVVCFAGGKRVTNEVAPNLQQFANRIRIAYTVYDKFWMIAEQVEDKKIVLLD